MWSGGRGYLREPLIFILESAVLLGHIAKALELLLLKLPHRPCRKAYDESAGWDDIPVLDKGSGADNGSLPHLRTVQNPGPDPYERAIFYPATVKDGAMAHGHAIAYDGGVEVSVNMNQAAVLYVRAPPYADVVDITSEEAVEPDAALLTHLHITCDDGGGGNPG